MGRANPPAKTCLLHLQVLFCCIGAGHARKEHELVDAGAEAVDRVLHRQLNMFFLVHMDGGGGKEGGSDEQMEGGREGGRERERE